MATDTIRSSWNAIWDRERRDDNDDVITTHQAHNDDDRTNQPSQDERRPSSNPDYATSNQRSEYLRRIRDLEGAKTLKMGIFLY